MSMSPEYMQKVLDIVVREAVDRGLATIDAFMGPDGETFGMVQATGAEFIAAYLDLKSRIVVTETPLGPIQWEMRRLDRIEVIAPKLAAKWERQVAQERAKQRERVA